MDWLMWSDEVTEITGDFWTKVDCIIMGRKTYEVAMKMQPPPEEVSESYKGIKTYVFSHTLPEGTQPGGAEVLRGDPVEFVRNLKQQEGKEICILGGGDLAHSLLEAKVIDEIGFNIHPILLGSGTPLFRPMARRVNLELIEGRVLKNGCVYVLYRVKP
jgi:dihydrofolate reductase